MIVDFAGFGTTTAVRPGGRVIQVGLGRSEATISTAELVFKAVTLRGARGGRVRDFQSVIDLIAKGDLEILTNITTFDGIPDAIEHLKDGGVLGRIVAVMEWPLAETELSAVVFAESRHGMLFRRIVTRLPCPFRPYV